MLAMLVGRQPGLVTRCVIEAWKSEAIFVAATPMPTIGNMTPVVSVWPALVVLFADGFEVLADALRSAPGGKLSLDATTWSARGLRGAVRGRETSPPA